MKSERYKSLSYQVTKKGEWFSFLTSKITIKGTWLFLPVNKHLKCTCGECGWRFCFQNITDMLYWLHRKSSKKYVILLEFVKRDTLVLLIISCLFQKSLENLFLVKDRCLEFEKYGLCAFYRQLLLIFHIWIYLFIYLCYMQLFLIFHIWIYLFIYLCYIFSAGI